ncbi:hypothetical protein EV127DRAFT_404852 [Xylaria flabelliformis]|nr:hypothetical protein EV127DRAFT_404852 [Xylaria flabelliformis]
MRQLFINAHRYLVGGNHLREKAVWQSFYCFFLLLGTFAIFLILRKLSFSADDRPNILEAVLPEASHDGPNDGTNTYGETERGAVATICDMHASIGEITGQAAGVINLFDYVDMDGGLYDQVQGARHICKACLFPQDAPHNPEHILRNRVVCLLHHSDTRDTYRRVFLFGGPGAGESQAARQERYGRVCKSAGS